MKKPLLACLALVANLAQAHPPEAVACPSNGQSGQQRAKDSDECCDRACRESGSTRCSQP
ncbi:hypothetical protein GALL_504280 [mine drainage metagenome]|uniref:Uncharacterized protein n=1 Tax=mine drainage metagenome TaxID=410659 RepID=A0A1J5P8R1_9ZZZZ